MSASKDKILILSGDLGDGHKQAANAVLEAARMLRPDVPVEVRDIMEWTHPYLHSIGRYVYIQGIKTFPSVYGYFYHKTRKPNYLSHTIKNAKWFGLRRMMKLLDEVRPSVVVSTFPIASAAMSILKANGLTTVPTATIITDHTDHSYWIHPFTDQYIVGSDHVRRALHQLDISDSQIAVTGIPVRPNFCRSYDRSAMRKKHSLDQTMPTVLVMGGGCGMIGKGVSKLLAGDTLPERIQFIIVCGHNEKIKQQLEKQLAGCKHRVVLTGYIDYVHELMAASDMIITKPGGLTTTEATALELPMLLYKPLPGQEQDNTNFLLKAGVAKLAADETHLSRILVEVLSDPHVLMEMQNYAKQLQAKHAAFKAADVILQTQNTAIPNLQHAWARV